MSDMKPIEPGCLVMYIGADLDAGKTAHAIQRVTTDYPDVINGRVYVCNCDYDGYAWILDRPFVALDERDIPFGMTYIVEEKHLMRIDGNPDEVTEHAKELEEA